MRQFVKELTHERMSLTLLCFLLLLCAGCGPGDAVQRVLRFIEQYAPMGQTHEKEQEAMSLWHKQVGPTLLWGGEEELMAYPPHIRRAFAWMNAFADDTRDEKQEAEDEAAKKQKYYGDFMRENVQRFAQRWGGLEEAALLRALHEDGGIDRLTAIFALGYSSFPHALDIIASYLESTHRLERCAAACVMGVKRDERAISVLKEFYLQDDIDDSGQLIPEADFWYQRYYAFLALILANWGPPEMTEVLRSALLRINSLKHQFSIGHDSDTPTSLFYALGRRGDLSIFYDVKLSERGRYMALFSLAAGYLNAYERYDMLYWTMQKDEGLRREIRGVWKDYFRLSDQEIRECFAALDRSEPLFGIDWWTNYDDWYG
jgi:hypothetical protein